MLGRRRGISSDWIREVSKLRSRQLEGDLTQNIYLLSKARDLVAVATSNRNFSRKGDI